MVYWDVLIGLLIVYVIMVTPYQVFFSIPLNEAQIIVEYVVCTIFLLDILLTFNVAIVREDDIVVCDRSVIAWLYLTNYFAVDLVSSFPWTAVLPAESNMTSYYAIHILQLLRLLRLLRIFKFSRLASSYGGAVLVNPTVLHFVFLVLQVCFTAHMVACIWYRLATNDFGEIQADSWVAAYEARFGYESQSSLDLYVASLYWTFVTMLTVGYGDITPATFGERKYAVVCMITGAVMFGAGLSVDTLKSLYMHIHCHKILVLMTFLILTVAIIITIAIFTILLCDCCIIVIAQISRLMRRWNPRAQEVKAKKNMLKAYLNEKNVNVELQKRANDAYAYYLDHQSPFTANADSVIFELPESLLTELARHVFEKEMHTIELFKALLQAGSSAFIMQILKNSRQCRAKRGEVIYNVGDVCDEMVFVMDGLIRISTHIKEQEIVAGYARRGGFCGDFEFLTKTTRLSVYTAASQCHLVAVSYSSLTEAILQHYDAGCQLKQVIQQRLNEFRSLQRQGELRPIDEFMIPPNDRNTPTPAAVVAEETGQTGEVCATIAPKLSSSKKCALPLQRRNTLSRVSFERSLDNVAETNQEQQQQDLAPSASSSAPVVTAPAAAAAVPHPMISQTRRQSVSMYFQPASSARSHTPAALAAAEETL
jgi:hypothetical protein